MSSARFHRSTILLGKENMERIANAKIIIFGVGGVGGWCAESLARTGFENLTIVDPDRICPTNINRQIVALTSSIGKIKVEVLKERLLDINPNAKITALRKAYCKDSAHNFELENYDYIIDCIDSLSSKVHLIKIAMSLPNTVFFSSMGAALKLDASRVKSGNFWDVEFCPLARQLRKQLRRQKVIERDFTVVYSEELLENSISDWNVCGNILCPARDGKGSTDNTELCKRKSRTNGSLVHVTAVFGFMLAGLVVKNIISEK